MSGTIDAPATDARDIGASVVSYLKTVAQVQSLMGSGYASRIRPGMIPQETSFEPESPHVTVMRIETRHERTLRGRRQDLTRSFVQVDVWAKTDQERTNLAAAVRAALRPERFHGYWLGLEIRDLSIETDADSDEDAGDGSEERDWRTLFRLSIWHRNTEI